MTTFKMPEPVAWIDKSLHPSTLVALRRVGYVPLHTAEAMRDVLEQAAQTIDKKSNRYSEWAESCRHGFYRLNEYAATAQTLGFLAAEIRAMKDQIK